MYLRSLEGCRLAIGAYPPFDYDARGGGGKGTLVPTQKENVQQLSFSPETFSIPTLSSQTTKFLSLPLPPGLQIKMSMKKLEGTIDTDSGEILLNFESRFTLSIGSIFNFPDLLVHTSLETGNIKGHIHEGNGLVRQENGQTRLVGIAMIPVTGNKILDYFLGLPNEALAVLQCEIKK
mgnify:CR=1 FL=1